MRADRSDGFRPDHVSADDRLAEVTIRGRLKSGTAVVFALLFGAAVAGLLFVTVSPRAEANPRNAAVVLASSGLLLCLCAGAALARRERLVIGDNEILHEKSLAGIRWARREIDRRSVDTVRVQARGAGGHGLAIVGREGRLLAGSGLTETDLEWLRAWVEGRLNREA